MEITPFEDFSESGITIIGKLCSLNAYQQLRNYFNNMKIVNNYLIVDLRRCTFTSSHGLGELVAISNSLTRRRKKLILFSPREEIFNVITLSGIDQVITVLHSAEEVEKECSIKKD